MNLNFEEAGRQYVVLREQFDNNHISREEFVRAVGELVVTGPDGKMWALEPFAATWAEQAPGAGSVSPAPAKTGEPQSLLQLLAFLGKGLLKNLPRMLLIGLLMAVLTWVAHTYIIAKVNDGLMYNAGKVAVNSVVHLQETHFPGVNAFWGLLSYFLTSFFMRAFSMGPQKWLKTAMLLPDNVKQSLSRSKDTGQVVILAGVFAALFIMLLFRNYMLSWVLAIGILLVMTAHFAGMETLLLRTALLDLRRFTRRLIVPQGQEEDGVYLLLLGMCGGFLLAGIFKAGLTFTIIGLLLVAGLYLYLQHQQKAKAALLLVLFGSAFLLREHTVFAWCEGASLSQVGGSWVDWWGMNNADLVRRLGLVPAGFSFVGGLLGSAAVFIQQLPGLGSSTVDTTGVRPLGLDLPISPVNFGSPLENPFTKFSGGDGPGGCSRFGLPNYWVNTATLNLVVRDTVFAAGGVGPPVNLTLTYNSASDAKGMFGRGWSFSYEWSLAELGRQVVLHKGSGQELSYTANTPGTAEQPSDLLPPAGTGNRLISFGDYWLYHVEGSPYFQRFDRVPGTSLARLTAIKDYYGQKVQLGYDDRGNIATVTDAAGRAIRFAYNEHNLCSSFTLPDGRKASFQYDGAGRLVRALDLMEVSTDYSYDEGSCLTEMVVGRTRRTTRFAYCNKGSSKLVETVTNANGAQTRYEMVSVEPRQVKVTGPDGKAAVYYSTAGLTEMVVDAAGHTTRNTYHAGRLVSSQDQNGNVTTREYDEQGTLLAETNPAGHKLTFAYDAAGNLLQVADPTGAAWRYRYDDKHKLVGTTTPAGRDKSMRYDERGLLVEITGYGGERTTFEHDRCGNMTAVSDAAGQVIRFTYDEYGYNKTSMTDQLGNTIAYQFDANGRVVHYSNPDATEKSIGYDCCYPIIETDENGRSTIIERDANGNTLRTFDQAGNASELTYDAADNPISYRDELGRSSFYSYDEAGRLLQVTDPLGQRQVLGYDPAGNLVSLWVEGERPTVFSYDANHLLISTTDPLGARITTERDVLGRITAIQNVRGNRINLSYDPDSLLTAKHYDGGEIASYAYDEGGKLSEMQDQTGKTSFAYDSLGRLQQISYPGGFALSYRYDGAGNLRALTYPGDLTVEYDYDSRNRPVSMSWEGQFIKFAYDGTGNLLAEERSNGTISHYAYNEVGRMAGLSHGRGEGLFIKWDYLHDAAGNILEQQGFQPLAPLVDNLDSYTCNQADQLLGGENDAFNYDADGNLVEAAGEWSGSYDAENRLVELRRGHSRIAYTYNGLGQRVQVTDERGTRNYYYNLAGTLQFETDYSGGAVRCYLHCGGRLIASVDREGKTLFYHFDQAGNTLALTGGDGEVVASYAYSPFGLSKEMGEAGDNPFTYSGCFGVMREKTGDLYFMQHRTYAAGLGRFLQKDPLGIEGGVNLYAYAGNNPLRYVDPAGTLLMEAFLLLKVTGKVVGIVTTAAGVGKMGYTAADSTYAFTQMGKTRDDARNAWSAYRDGSFDSPQAEEDAYQRYLDAWKRHQDISDRAWGGPERFTNTALETGAELLIPDAAQVPYQGTKYQLTKDMKCGFTQSTSKNLRPNDRLTPERRNYIRTIRGR